DPSTPTTFLTEYRELSITNNVIPYVLEADATNFPDTFGILTGYLFNGVGSNDHALLEGITIEGNQIGLRDDSDSRDTGCLWATFFLLSTDPAAFSGNQENLDCRNVRVSNNVLNSEFTNVTFYHDGTNNAFSARKLDNVTVSNNTCFRRQEVYPAGGKHSTLASYIFFFRCVNSVLHETNISNNTTSVYRYSTGAAPGTTYSVRGLSILNEATLGLYASDNIRVHNNSLDTAPHWDVSTEAGASLFVNFTNVIKGTNFSFKDNTCSGFLAFDANATSGDLDWAGIEIENNQFGDPLSNGEEMQGRWGPARAMLITLSSSTAPTSQWAGVGVNNVSICGNRMTTHVTPSTPTRDNFQIQIIGINTNFHHWKVSDNQINALNSDNAGGIIVQPREFAHMYDWEICGNQIIGGGMPHVCWMAIDNAIVNGLRIEDNECSKINFPDGGWNASSGHPDAVILFEGSAPNVNDREGDERISISNNSIQLIKSTRPVIVDSNGVGFNTIPQNGVIFFGPSPDIDFDNGSGSESWKSVRNVVIEGNRMEQTDIDAGIVVNTYPVQFDVSCLSVSRNQIGHPTKNITDVTGSFVTPGHGITIQGKKLYSANALPEEAGRMGMTELAVENNQIILFSDSQNNNQLYGIDLFWKSDWDNSVINTQVGVQAYTVSDSSVSHNEIYFQETAAATIVKGIRVAATSELHNLRIDGN
ncbi:MAG: hypothetical protein VX828_03340, partial [Candidatus Thermoplasmatota archaeon]|nr:hypothetical protein [Candidatus Thermoplasmatota archaeon]